ncbi:MAG: calcium-binding protein [Candidatus Competibacterales bacterium]
MATFTFPGSDDIIYLNTDNGEDNTYIGGVGNDTYVLSNELVPAGATITISDSAGANVLQFAPGLEVAQTIIAADSVLHVLSNGAQIIIDGASSFDFEVGANIGAGVAAAAIDYETFAEDVFGVADLPTGDDTVEGTPNVTVPGGDDPVPGDTFTVTEDEIDAAGGGVIPIDEDDLAGATVVEVESDANSDANILITDDLDITITAGAGNDTLTGEDGNETISGGEGDDSLRGNNGNDVLDGEDGADILVGGAGTDVLMGGNGADDLSGGDGNDTLMGEAGDDVITGGAGNDSIVGLEGTNNIDAGSGDDIIVDDDGSLDDVIDGGDGTDTLTLTSGNDDFADLTNVENVEFLTLTDGDFFLFLEEDLLNFGETFTVDGSTLGNNDDVIAVVDDGNEIDYTISITTGDGDDLIIGRNENGIDTLIGGDGADTVVGRDGADAIDGGDGDDLLVAGTFAAGDNDGDSLTGGGGEDTFVVNDFNAADTITDFTADDDIIAVDVGAGGNLITNTSGGVITEVSLTGTQEVDGGDFFSGADLDDITAALVSELGTSTGTITGLIFVRTSDNNGLYAFSNVAINGGEVTNFTDLDGNTNPGELDGGGLIAAVGSSFSVDNIVVF